MRRRVPSSRSNVAGCPLYGVSPLLLAETFRLPTEFTETWKRRLRRNPSDAAAVACFINRDLGAFDSAWAGWVCKDGLLWPPDSVAVDPGQVRAIPLVRAQVAEYERAQRWMIDRSLQDQSRARMTAEVSELLHRAIEALRQR